MTNDRPTPEERDCALWARAFPPEMAADARAAALSFSAARLKPSGSFDAVVSGQHVEIVYRIYNPVPGAEVRSELTTRQLRILDCMLTRHHDGFVRQDAALRAISSGEPWVVPFIVYLIGEYVAEIVEAIGSELTAGDPRLSGYRDFARENKGLMKLVRERAISYWNCNYRARWASFNDYPALPLLGRLRSVGPTG